MRTKPENKTAKKPGILLSKVSVTNDMLHQLAFDNSAQANIITTASTGKIILANSAACKLLGYSKKELLTKSRSAIFDIKESSFKTMLKQRSAEGQSKALVTVIKKNGKAVQCEIRSAVFSDGDGIKKAITTITDMSQNILKQKNIDVENEKIVADNIVLAKSRQKKIDIKNEKTVADNIVLARSKQQKIDTKKEKTVSNNIKLAKAKSKKEMLNHETKARKELLAEIEKNFRLIFNASSDPLFDSDLVANKVMINDAYQNEFGYKTTGELMPAEDWLNHIHADDKDAVKKDYLTMLASPDIEWKYNFRFLKADHSIANVLSKGIVLRNRDGKAYRRIGYLLDISKQTVLEERLEREIKLKEMQIAEASEDAKDTERSDIGMELHDNINQLLGASKMYLEMAKRGGENSEMYLSRSSEYTLTAIEEIRKLTKGLTTDIIKNLGLCEAIDKILHDTMEVNNVKISCEMKSFQEDSVSDKFKLNVFRILQEHLNNILKHARASKVRISLSQNVGAIKLSVSDNGIGFDTNKKRKGIGVDNIKSRAASYNGTADFVSESSQGCILTAIFPINERMLNKN